jgi:MFS family permease
MVSTVAPDPAEEMRTFLYMILAVLIVLMVGVTKVVQRGEAEGQGVTDGAAFKQFQRTYVFVYCWMVAGDWLQGPYVYALYEHYGYGIADIGVLFIAGFGSSMLFGTFVGSACDKAGRKNGCLGYALIYSASCVTKHSPNYWVLMFGRLLGGIATSLLFSAFESWMVTEHKRQNFSDEALGQTFSRATLLNGVVAVSSGFIGQWARDIAGPVAPFDTAVRAPAAPPPSPCLRPLPAIPCYPLLPPPPPGLCTNILDAVADRGHGDRWRGGGQVVVGKLRR